MTITISVVLETGVSVLYTAGGIASPATPNTQTRRQEAMF